MILNCVGSQKMQSTCVDKSKWQMAPLFSDVNASEKTLLNGVDSINTLFFLKDDNEARLR